MQFPPPRSLLLVLVVACLIWGWTRSTTAASVTDTFDIVQRINAERIRRGLAPVVAEARLSAAAQGHSDDMASRDFVDHRGSDGRSYWQRASAAGYVPQTVGEVITAGQPTSESAVQAWFNSGPHLNILMVPDITHIGVGHGERSGTRYGHYWVVVVGRPAGNYVPSLVPTPQPPAVESPRFTETPRPPTSTPRPTATPTPTGTPFPPEIVGRLAPRQFLPMIVRGR